MGYVLRIVMEIVELDEDKCLRRIELDSENIDDIIANGQINDFKKILQRNYPDKHDVISDVIDVIITPRNKLH